MIQTTRNFFWRSGWSVEQSCLGRWLLKNKKNSPSTINNHLLFDALTPYRQRERQTDRERERERQKISKGLWTDTKRHTPLPLPHLTLWTQTSYWQLFQNVLIFIHLKKFRISVGLCHLVKLLPQFSCVPNSLFSFPQSNLSQKIYEFILFTF